MWYDPDELYDDLEDLSVIFPSNSTFMHHASFQDHPWSPRMGWLPFSKEPTLRPIFVLGLPRSGSSLLEQALASHPLAWGAGEGSPLGHIVAELLEDIVEWGAVRPDRVEALRRQYVTAMQRRAPIDKQNAVWVVDKGLGNVK